MSPENHYISHACMCYIYIYKLRYTILALSVTAGGWSDHISS